MDLANIMKEAKTSKTGEKKGFTFAGNISEEAHKQLEEIRGKARTEGKIMSNVALAEAAINELHKTYVGPKKGQ